MPKIAKGAIMTPKPGPAECQLGYTKEDGRYVMKRLISLLAAVTAVVMFALPGFAQTTSYVWELDCSNASLGLGVGTGANWFWLNNGSVISFSDPSNGFASCATPPLSGSAVIPDSINGIQVNGIQVSISVSASVCLASATVTKSFDPSTPDINISENVSLPGSVDVFSTKVHCPKASFNFGLSS